MKNNPMHPGLVLRELVFSELEIPLGEAAARLGMSRPALSRVLNGHAAISPDLAIRLERAGEGTARFWLTLQTNYGLAQALNHPQPEVRPLVAV